MEMTVFGRCVSPVLFTGAIVPLHVSTTILERRQTEAAVNWDLEPWVPPLPVVNGAGLSNQRRPGSVSRLPALCLLPLYFCYPLFGRYEGRGLQSAAARCMLLCASSQDFCLRGASAHSHRAWQPTDLTSQDMEVETVRSLTLTVHQRVMGR
jgi:hypothetical protein